MGDDLRDIRRKERELKGTIVDGAALLGTILSAGHLVQKEQHRNVAAGERTETQSNNATGGKILSERRLDDIENGGDGRLPRTVRPPVGAVPGYGPGSAPFAGNRNESPLTAQEAFVMQLALAAQHPENSNFMRQAEQIARDNFVDRNDGTVHLSGKVSGLKAGTQTIPTIDFGKSTVFGDLKEAEEAIAAQAGFKLGQAAAPQGAALAANAGRGQPEAEESRLANNGITTSVRRAASQEMARGTGESEVNPGTVTLASNNTGAPTPAGQQPPAGKPAPAEQPAPQEQTQLTQKQLNQQAQVALERMGFDTGQFGPDGKTRVEGAGKAKVTAEKDDAKAAAMMDGDVGRKTKPGLHAMQEALGEPVTNEASPALLAKIKAAKPEELAAKIKAIEDKAAGVAPQTQAPQKLTDAQVMDNYKAATTKGANDVLAQADKLGIKHDALKANGLSAEDRAMVHTVATKEYETNFASISSLKGKINVDGVITKEEATLITEAYKNTPEGNRLAAQKNIDYAQRGAVPIATTRAAAEAEMAANKAFMESTTSQQLASANTQFAQLGKTEQGTQLAARSHLATDHAVAHEGDIIGNAAGTKKVDLTAPVGDLGSAAALKDQPGFQRADLLKPQVYSAFKALPVEAAQTAPVTSDTTTPVVVREQSKAPVADIGGTYEFASAPKTPAPSADFNARKAERDAKAVNM